MLIDDTNVGQNNWLPYQNLLSSRYEKEEAVHLFLPPVWKAYFRGVISTSSSLACGVRTIELLLTQNP